MPRVRVHVDVLDHRGGQGAGAGDRRIEIDETLRCASVRCQAGSR
jgi:hypothetical protein